MGSFASSSSSSSSIKGEWENLSEKQNWYVTNGVTILQIS